MTPQEHLAKSLDFVEKALRPKKRHEVDGCSFCERFKGQMHPSHDASDRCESGKHEHCTCDVCF